MSENTTLLSKLTLNVNGLNTPNKRYKIANRIKIKDPTICCLQDTHQSEKNKHWLRVKE
jgi:exonuclease III